MFCREMQHLCSLRPSMKVPPYGKPLRALMESGNRPSNCIYLYIGKNAWDKGKNSSICRNSRTLALPFEKSPYLYDWPVNGCDILVIETSPVDTDYIDILAGILFGNEAKSITLISSSLLVTTYKKDF